MLRVLRWLAVLGGALISYVTVTYHLQTAVMNPLLPYFVATLIFLPPLEAGCAFVVVTSYATYNQITAPGAPPLEVVGRIVLVAAIFALIVYIKHHLAARTLRLIAAEGQAARLAADDAELRAQAAERRAADRSAFMSAAAHELRTPLTVMRGYTEIAQDTMEKTAALMAEGKDVTDPAYAAQRSRFARMLPAMVRQTQKMERLVLLLLDVGRLEQGHLTLEVERTDLAALVREAAGNATIVTNDHTIDLRGIPSALEVVCDPVRIEQVLVNLLQNAQQYSPPGSTIRVRLEQDGTAAVLCIDDEGLGIAPAERDAVWARFYQVGRTERSQGLGLGLYLVKMFVEMHGGTAGITDGPGGKGTTVEVRLPLAPTAAVAVD